MPVGNEDIKMIEDGKNLFQSQYCSSFVVADDTTDGNRRSLFSCQAFEKHGVHGKFGTPVHFAANGDTWFREGEGEWAHWQHEGDVLVELNMSGA
jgi:hypothetical protein